MCREQVGVICEENEHCLATFIDDVHEATECAQPYDIGLVGELKLLFMYVIFNYFC